MSGTRPREDRDKKMTIFRDKTKKMTHLNIFYAKILAYVKKKQYFCIGIPGSP